MSVTDQCSRCGGDCPFNPDCRECGGCENTGVQPCPVCYPPPGDLSGGDWNDEPCQHDHDEDCDEYGCTHQHCMNCGGCGCPGYCDDTSTYNLRPAETGGPQ
jgi:hypothetical protein